MAFFLPSSTSTSTTTSSSSSPLRVPPSLEPEDNESERNHNVAASAERRRSNDTPMAQNTLFGLLRQIDYLSGASASEISSLEEDSSDSEVESSRTRRTTFGDDDGHLDTNMRSPRSSREDARSPSRDGRRSPENYEVVEMNGPRAGTSSQNVRVQQTRGTSASLMNQVEMEETTKRRSSRHGRHGSPEIDRNARKQAKLRHNRRRHIFELSISRDFILIIILCFGLACAWIVLARPIVRNWFESRSGDEYIYMDV